MQRPNLPGIACALAVVAAAAAAGAKPPPPHDVARWADASRVIAAESGSPHPGRWRTELVPYTREIMECLSFSHPCEDVVFKKSAQVAGTEVGVNLLGSIVCDAPCPVLIVLPTIDEGLKYNRVKLQPAIDATPPLRDRVADEKSRSAAGSTAGFKRFRGGFAIVTGANSSAGLQMVSARVIVFEEVSEYPWDAGGRGDPVDQALQRSKAWESSRPKRFYNSTPALKGSCRISAKYEASDQRRYYVPCPHCGDYQVLRRVNLTWSTASASSSTPQRAQFACMGCGSMIDEWHRSAMLAGGCWIKTFPGGEGDPAPGDLIKAAEIERWRQRSSAGRQPGFAIWQAYSPFVGWGKTLRELEAAVGDPTKEKTVTQQVEGEDYEERGDAPDSDKLYEARIDYPGQRVPPGALFLTGAADVQSNRIQWAVYAWGMGLTRWLVDRGTIEGDPASDEVWRQLRPVIDRQYADQFGVGWPIDAFGVDSGYLSQQVYRFVRPLGATGRVFALDGRSEWKLPALGSPSKVDVDYGGRKIGSTLLWPVGTWDLKSETYAAIRKAIEGPDADGSWPSGTLFMPARVADDGYCKQITAEYLAEEAMPNGLKRRRWERVASRANEDLDIAVYSLALAHHLSDHMTPQDWAALAAQRATPPSGAQPDMAALWAPGLVEPRAGGSDDAGVAAAFPTPRQPDDQPVETANDVRRAAEDEDWLGEVADDWLGSA